MMVSQITMLLNTDGSYNVDLAFNGSSLTTIAGQYQITAKDAASLLSTAVMNTVWTLETLVFFPHTF
jgi:hypothetical protein